MLVPGVSGGSMAMILGIYQKLISAISSFWENKKKNLIFLLLFSAGAVLGMVLFAKPAEELRRKEVAKQKSAELAAVGGEKAKPRPVVRRASERVGRNDPCPCGSGKKYKQCCGKPGGSAHEES